MPFKKHKQEKDSKVKEDPKAAPADSIHPRFKALQYSAFQLHSDPKNAEAEDNSILEPDHDDKGQVKGHRHRRHHREKGKEAQPEAVEQGNSDEKLEKDTKKLSQPQQRKESSRKQSEKLPEPPAKKSVPVQNPSKQPERALERYLRERSPEEKRKKEMRKKSSRRIEESEPKDHHRHHHHKESEPRSKPKVKHINDFQAPQWHRPHLLEDLLHFLKHFEMTNDVSKAVNVVTKFDIPRQEKLFEHNFYSDPMPFSFGDYIKLVFSRVLRSWSPLNTGQRYIPSSRYVPTLMAVRYKGVQMHPDEFVRAETFKAAKRKQALESIKSEAEDEAHVEFLKNLTIQQISSLPLTVMHDVLYQQIQIVEKLCESYSKLLGASNDNTKVAIAHYNLMQKHLQVFQFMGLRTMPPLRIVRKYEEQPKEENSQVTSSSSSNYEDELEEFVVVDEELTIEEKAIQEAERQEKNLLGQPDDPGNKTYAPTDGNNSVPPEKNPALPEKNVTPPGKDPVPPGKSPVTAGKHPKK